MSKLALTVAILFQLCFITTDGLESKKKLNELLEELIVKGYGENGIIYKSDFDEFASRILYNIQMDKKNTSQNETSLFLQCMKNLTETDCRMLIANKCFNRETIFNLFSTNSSLNLTSISLTFPALLHNLVSNACISEGHHGDRESRDHKPLPSAQSWGYGLAAVALIVLISNIGGLMAPCMKSDFFQRILMYFVALAAGTLGSTGTMILIPEALGLTFTEDLVPNYSWKLATFLGGIYIFYVLERFLKLYFQIKRKRKSDKYVIVRTPATLANGKEHKHFPSETPEDQVPFTNQISEESSVSLEDKKKAFLNPVETVKEKRQVAPVAWLMLIGDALHNFVDGISIGAAFTENVYIGISVTLAIICEELPHELGDIAILLHSGMSMKRALFLNFLAALTAVIGVVIGILLGENTDANTWIFAGAGGMFIYLSLVDMVPEMSEQAVKSVESGDSPLFILFIQNLGLLSGFAIICLLANLGGDIAV